MTKACDITGKRPITGNNVSHAHNKTKRRFLPNLHKRRIWVPSEKRYVTLKVSARGLRTIDKIGIEAALEKMNNNEDIN